MNLELELLNRGPKILFPNAPFQRATATHNQTINIDGTKTYLNIIKFQNYMSWNPYPPFPYMDQVNGMFNQNGPMIYWEPNV